jgi:hypothetical protein
LESKKLPQLLKQRTAELPQLKPESKNLPQLKPESKK